jgi:hypothetical protein
VSDLLAGCLVCLHATPRRPNPSPVLVSAAALCSYTDKMIGIMEKAYNKQVSRRRCNFFVPLPPGFCPLTHDRFLLLLAAQNSILRTVLMGEKAENFLPVVVDSVSAERTSTLLPALVGDHSMLAPALLPVACYSSQITKTHQSQFAPVVGQRKVRPDSRSLRLLIPSICLLRKTGPRCG